jgi:hypothetical protein
MWVRKTVLLPGRPLAAAALARYLQDLMRELFEAVRAACPSGTWTKAIELVRHFAVTEEHTAKPDASDKILVCRVRRTDRAIPAVVQLYPDDTEWDCDCESRVPCCEHVAAAVIALKKARSEGKPLQAALTSVSNLGYRFSRAETGLRLERFVIRSDGSRIPLRMTLASAVAQRATGLDFSPTQIDLQVDRLLGASGIVKPEHTLALLKLLAGHKNVHFADAPAEIADEPLRPRATVRAAASGFVLELGPNPEVREIVAPFVGWTGSALVPLSATEYCGPRYENIDRERLYPPEELAVLVTEVLPEIARWFVVDMQTDRLPEVTTTERPRAVVDVRQEQDQLSVLATLVYGDPPIARVDRNKLVHIDGPVPKRMADLERRAIEHLRQSLGLVPGIRAVMAGKEAAQFAAKLDHWRGELTGQDVEQWVLDTTLRPVLSAGDVLPRFTAGLAGGREILATASSAIKAFRQGVSFVPLTEGGFARLPLEWLTEYAGLLERLLEAQSLRADKQLPAYLLPTRVLLHEALDAPLPPDLQAARQLLSGMDHLPEVELPHDLTLTLRPYQMQGVRWLQLQRSLGLGAILADDMGLGKTLQALCVVGRKTLVVCPTSLLANWRAETERCRPALSKHVYHGPDRRLSLEADVTLTTYSVLRSDTATLADCEWNTVILDEAQAIKNPESQVAQAAHALRANFRLALTGTPIENRLDDLWSQLHFANPGLLGPRTEFVSRYAEPIQRGDADATARLKQICGPFVLRRTKLLVAPELPSRTEQDLYFDLADAEQELYGALKFLAQREVVAQLSEGRGVMEALEALLRLRQAACHPSLVPGQTAAISSKLTLLLEQLQTAIADGHKCLVFSQWTSFLDLIEPHLRQASFSYTRLDGSTRDRGRVVENFQKDSGPSVLLLSLKAGGTGLNLTAADHVFLMDLWWNPAVEQQAADRVHRIGQQRPVFVHRLIARGTVEERIVALHAQKRALSDNALEDAAQVATLTRDELVALLA